MDTHMLKIRVPATTANMGAGFDCFGMALNLYNELTLEEADDGGISTSKDNLIFQTISRFYQEIGKVPPTLRLVQEDNIPMARGLGSSSACIVAGLTGANELAGRPMTIDDLAHLASDIEGHPDNVAPAVYGGLVVMASESGKLYHVKVTPPEELSFVAFIPEFHLPTENARGILPGEYSKADTVFNVARASLFIASMISGKWDNLPIASADRIHQPYRKNLIPDWDFIFQSAYELGAKGVFLSGAGPTIMAMVLKSDADSFCAGMKNQLQTLESLWMTKILQGDPEGARII